MALMALMALMGADCRGSVPSYAAWRGDNSDERRTVAPERESGFFGLTDSAAILSLKFEHRRFDARPGAYLSPTIAIQGSASVPGVHARSSGSPKDYVEPTYAHA